MECWKCHKPIPDRAEKCPYCGAITHNKVDAVLSKAADAINPKKLFKKLGKYICLLSMETRRMIPAFFLFSIND